MKFAQLIALLLFITIFVYLSYHDLKYRKMKIPLSDTFDSRMQCIDAKKNPIKFWLIFILQTFTFLYFIYFLITSLLE